MNVSTWAFRLVVSLAAAVIVAQPAGARTLNGFDLSDASIPPDEIFRGGPPRDGIPALTNPDYITANEASFLEDRDRVLGVAINGTPPCLSSRDHESP